MSKEIVITGPGKYRTRSGVEVDIDSVELEGLAQWPARGVFRDDGSVGSWTLSGGYSFDGEPSANDIIGLYEPPARQHDGHERNYRCNISINERDIELRVSGSGATYDESLTAALDALEAVAATRRGAGKAGGPA